MSHIASSSKGFPSQKSFDELMSSIPFFNQSTASSSSSSPSSSFRTSKILSTTANDPELYMGDDCDASYEANLLSSGLLDWLSKDEANIFHHSTPQKRLEMLLLHLTTSDPTAINDKKGKKKPI
ncbi:hypothetical protein INT46_002679 [Mucor plumbeus]|uniref:Uncharacterized protein n=1 Tax=Mucor plumbeus TaxID=97098 RepID=A0A8H7R6R0_9FUNG|nr:hypothetical protein INT46_002679 [Mucor plumbeus]